MAQSFNDLDGLRIAAELEKRGVELYRRAARICKKPEIVDLLSRLEADERMHQKEFARIYEQQCGEHGGADGAEQSALLSAMAADVVFPGGLVELGRESDGFESPAAILRYAIKGEKDSILFYEAMMEHAKVETRAVFGEIIREEKGHLTALTRMLREEEA